MSVDVKITRRKFIKWTAVVGGMVGVATILGAGGIAVFDKLGRARKLSGRTKERSNDSDHWFTPVESALLGALATIIIPSDETGPGALDADVVNTLDRMVAKSKNKQALYIGIDAFDEMAKHEYGQVFTALTHEQQINLIRLLDRIISDELTISGSSLLKRVKYYYYKYYYYKSGGLGATIALWPILVTDVMQAFYTSKVAWDWLGYDGPPIPSGYLGRTSCIQNR